MKAWDREAKREVEAYLKRNMPSDQILGVARHNTLVPVFNEETEPLGELDPLRKKGTTEGWVRICMLVAPKQVHVPEVWIPCQKESAWRLFTMRPT